MESCAGKGCSNFTFSKCVVGLGYISIFSFSKSSLLRMTPEPSKIKLKTPLKQC